MVLGWENGDKCSSAGTRKRNSKTWGSLGGPDVLPQGVSVTSPHVGNGNKSSITF